MLTEHFVASIGVISSPSNTNVVKDAGIFIHEFQPLVAQHAVYKKSATPPNCLAVSETHVFAAQAEKAVVHVYNRAKGNQEAVVPFTERITCLALACDDAVLVLGTKEGRVFLWEVCTGRLVTTAQSHLQGVTALAVDHASGFILSGSADSTVHVWSILSLLSFSNASTQASTPIRTFSVHRAEVTDLKTGHAASFCNFAISASQDRTCLIWDYHNNNLLRTYLLPSSPLCITLDPADRAVYLGYDDGSLQQIDLHNHSRGESIPEAIQADQNATAPRQPSAASHWKPPHDANGPMLSLSLSFDGSTLLSGHESGAIVGWDVASGRAQTNILPNRLPGPVNNLNFLRTVGSRSTGNPSFQSRAIVKPKVGAFDNPNGLVPGNYGMNVELCAEPSMTQAQSTFQQALTAHTFPLELLEDGLSELAVWHDGAARAEVPEETNDFMAFDDGPETSRTITLEEQNADLKAQLESLRRLQKASFSKIDKLSAERKALLQREQQRLTKRGTSRPQSRANGTQEAEDDLSNMDESDD